MPVESTTSYRMVLALWSQHEAELRRWLASRAPIKAEVDDLLQEVFIKVLRQMGHLQAVEQPRAWLFAVTRNTLIDRLRSDHDHLPLPDDLDQWPAEPAETTPAVDTLAQACLPRILSELAPEDREAIELCDLQGMAQADFAQLKNLSLPAAKSRVQRARRRMREHMTNACQVRFDDAGCVEDFVPRPALPNDY
jgi:RNA polymerase sigma-70 factor, ECF subfamily